ncbi:hypothetical protein GN956_G6523 [Arapaima gigas]
MSRVPDVFNLSQGTVSTPQRPSVCQELEHLLVQCVATSVWLSNPETQLAASKGHPLFGGRCKQVPDKTSCS